MTKKQKTITLEWLEIYCETIMPAFKDSDGYNKGVFDALNNLLEDAKKQAEGGK